MNRKNFLQTGAALSGLFLPFQSAQANDPLPGEEELAHILPAHLKKGDKIGITAPAGFITEKEIQPAVDKLTEWGFVPVIGSTIGKRDFTFGGTDAERAADFQQMLDSPALKAILCARGGYGMVRIIDRLNFSRFVDHPKWVIGFSDITVIHTHLNRNYGIASIHSKMCNSFPDDWSKAEQVQIDSINSIRDALSGVKMQYSVPGSSFNRTGTATGTLVGGNLKTIESLSGSKSDLKTAGKLLFVEDTGEYLYSIDRMFWNLKRTGKLDQLAGLIVGGFKVKVDDPGEDFGKTVQDIVLEKIKGFKYPVCFDFPVGHQKLNMALKCGVKHRLSITDTEVTLKEVASA